jgi:nucleoside phosphorylase
MDRILVIVAMEAEAAPLVAALDAAEIDRHPTLPMRTYATSVGSASVRIVVNGKDPRYGADGIGTIPAALTTHVAVESWLPDLVISVGTAGGWQRHGTVIGDVFMAWDRFVFHDHRIALPVFGAMSTADVPAADLRDVAAGLGFELGIVTTGDSLDESAEDRERIISSGAAVKDMEGAAVAWVANLHDVPVTAIKTVTDLVDHPTPTAEQFLANLATASAALKRATVAFLGEIAASR